MANKVASWKLFENKLTRPITSTLQKLPTYAEIILTNDSDIVNNYIDWPAGRSYGRLVLEEYYKEPAEYPQYRISIHNTDDFKNGQPACIPFYVDVFTSTIYQDFSTKGALSIIASGVTDDGYTLSDNELTLTTDTSTSIYKYDTYRVYVPKAFNTLTLTFKLKDHPEIYTTVKINGVRASGIVASFLNDSNKDIKILYKSEEHTIFPGYSYTQEIPANNISKFNIENAYKNNQCSLKKFLNTVASTSTAEVSISGNSSNNNIDINIDTTSEINNYIQYIFSIK